LSPLRGKEYLKDETDIKHSYDEHQLSSAKMINSRDMFDVRRSHLLIVNLKNAKRVSIGTVLEIGAAYILNKPIIVIMEPDEPYVSHAASGSVTNQMMSNVHKHSMLTEQATAIVSDLDTAIYFALQILG
jgi:nucleoside 2-deoxyribosyltransferase